jgi:multiple sugar transport system permease protein
LAPALLVLIAVGAYPIGYQVYISFTNLNLAFPGDAVFDLNNYAWLVRDPVYWHSVGILLELWFSGLALTMVLGTTLALLAFRAPLARRLMPALIIPMVATPIVVANFFQYLYSSDYGIIRYILELVGLYPGFNVTTNVKTVLWAIIAIDVWQWTPLVMLIVWAGLSSIPMDVVEASRVDGASTWRTISKVLLPMVSGSLGTAAIFRTVEGMRAFVIIWGLTRGGPGRASEATSVYLYNTAFRSLELGQAAAIGTGLVVLTLLLCTMLLRIVYRDNQQ